ncbi:MAG: HDIG domain-containing protein [Anaerolineales bacterium]|nr:HDIG domain-containing protein [Anaerolineales bacterium]
MSKELLELLPELDQIEDGSLRAKVISVWEEALRLGCWSIADLDTMPYTLLEPTDITFPQHVHVVCQLCLAMEAVLRDAYGERYPLNRDALIAGALLADVGKLMEFGREGEEYVWSDVYDYLRHPFSGVGLCYKHGLPLEVLHIIATHSWEGDRFQRRPESIIFHHADFVDFDLTKFATRQAKGSA